MRTFWILPALLCAGQDPNPPARSAPNVVVILTDDQGWGDLSLNGNRDLSTPHIDSIGHDGALFESFYVSPVCSPTRAEWLTGRYHVRGGVSSTSTGGERLDLDEKTVADAFKAAGYATGAFGKWHNGSQYPYHPNARGFDEYYGFTSGHWGDYFSPPLEHNGRPVRGNGYVTDDFTDRALDFITRNRDRSFFCYLPFNTPHSPMQVPDRFWEKFKDKDLTMDSGPKDGSTMARAALAMCENIDENVGRVLKKLDELKLAERTIVLYFHDNGPNSSRWNGGMRGRKGSTDEGGVRSPLLVRWPGRIASGTKIAPISGAIDLLPTLAELTGIRPVGTKPLDGTSMAPLLLGKANEQPDRMIFNAWKGKVSVRTQQYRLDHEGRLYDLTKDRSQERDLAAGQPEVHRKLVAAAQAWRREVMSELPQKDGRPYPVGYREFPITTLPARDGEPQGTVKRSSSAPNCSFFTNWTSLEDRMTWNVEVATAGRYEAVVYYACPAGDIGSTVELAFNGARVEGKVAEAHDPPAYGPRNDRFPRTQESPMKDFKPLRLGEIKLDQGRGALTLRAMHIAAKQVMEVRSVVLTLLE